MEEQALFGEEDFVARDTYPDIELRSEEQPLVLQEVHIDGLKGFDVVEIQLAPLTILTGPNNSGKSTVLQAIALAFETLRRCIDTTRWSIRTSAGRSIVNYEFLPVNEPRDLWYETKWKPTRDRERYIRITLKFSSGFEVVTRVRFLFGGLNIGIESLKPQPSEELLRALMESMPVLMPSTSGPSTHESFTTPGQVHRYLNVREPSQVLRNILLRLQEEPTDSDAHNFVASVLNHYFGIQLSEIEFDQGRDLEIRAPFREKDYELDIVSAGSGLNQILQLAAVVLWRKPGIVLLDEPDAHLHTSVQAQLLEFLNTLVETYNLQVIVATHSRDLISQAPLQSIVPIDRTRERLTPMASIDHLLLEYQRQGSITNIDLALLYQTKRCLFVEGPTDTRLLPRLAQRLDSELFVGHDQVVLFEFGGVEKITFLPELVQLFERVIGATLQWGVLRDSDANVPEVKEKHIALAETHAIPVFYQWQRYSIENYLIEPELLGEAINNKTGESTVTQDEVIVILEACLEDMADEVFGNFTTKAQAAYRAFHLSEDNYFEHGARAASRYLRSVSTLDEKLKIYPGKKLFGSFVEKLQNAHGVNIRLEDVISIIDDDNAPQELSECLAQLNSI